MIASVSLRIVLTQKLKFRIYKNGDLMDSKLPTR